MNLEQTIRATFSEILATSGLKLDTPLTRDSVLLMTGLDSLGFAILVARLEEELGYDPFVLMKESVYPQTFGEFLDIYEKYKPTE